jgi:hypothetical protein
MKLEQSNTMTTGNKFIRKETVMRITDIKLLGAIDQLRYIGCTKFAVNMPGVQKCVPMERDMARTPRTRYPFH